MKNLKYLLFLFIILISPNVFAQDFTVETSKITSPEGQGRTGTYSGLEIYNGGLPAVYNIGTRYNGRLSRIWFNLISGGYAEPEGFEKGHTYTLSMNMATQDWRNGFGSVSVKCEGSSGQELSNGRVTFVSMYKIKFSFTAPTDRWCQFVYIDLKSSNINSTYITGTSNWNLSSMVISDPAYCDNCGSGSGSGSGSTTDPNQTIIDNANENTSNIINNQNNNTQDIIDNANQNAKATQDVINNGLQTCRDSYNLSPLNSFTFSPDTNTNNYFITNKLLDNVEPNTTYTLSFNINTSAEPYMFSLGFGDNTYSVDFQFFLNLNNGNITKTFTTPSTINYSNLFIRLPRYSESTSFSGSVSNIMLVKGSTSKPFERYGEQVCKSKLDETNDNLNSLNDSINNSNVDSDTGSDFFNDFQDNTHGLTSIITAPLNAIQRITNSTCQPLSVPIPFTNSSVSLPCMSQVYEQNIPTIYNIWKIVSFGIIAYFICIDIFHIVKGFKDPESDKVEVLDL